jgi:hypothetical protein
MKALGYPFGPVNVEQFIFSIYGEISPIDAVAPTSNGLLPSDTVFSVTNQTPASYALDVQWQIDGVPVPGANETNFCPENYLAANTVQTLTVKVADNTILVRDEIKRQNLLTNQENWLVWKPSADFDDNGIVDTKDLLSMVTWWLSDKTDFDIAPPGSDGIVNFQDFSVLAAQWKQPSADFDDNGIVDAKDLLSMVTWWLSDKTDFDIAPSGGDGIVNFQDFSVLAAQWLNQ